MMTNTNTKQLLQTEQLCIGYPRKKEPLIVASQIDLSINRGQLMAVIGINGAGKTTLIKTLTHELRPLSGSVELNNVPIENHSPKKRSGKISVVLTDRFFSKNLGVFELVALGRQPYTNWLGTLAQKDKEAVNNALTQVDIRELSAKKCGELSDGQLQKVLLARALAQDTDLIFMDEPTAHLDLYHKAYVLQLLKKLTQNTQKAIVFATHELNLALRLCDQIILMHNGKTVQESPQELIRQRLLEDIFPREIIRFDSATESFQVIPPE